MAIENILLGAKIAAAELNLLTSDKINEVLLAVAQTTEESVAAIVEANQQDLARMDKSNPMYDRLMLDEQRIRAIAQDIRMVAALNSPLGETITSNIRPNGMKIDQVRVPFGVVGIIYEARPNVSFDVFSLCFKTGNAAVLKGGSDAEYSNRAIVDIIRKVLQQQGVDPNAVNLISSDRQTSLALMKAEGFVDVIIPRGSSSLIDFVRRNSLVPVIETGAGICHTYIDKSADIIKSAGVVLNAKTRRVSVCNSLDCLIVHGDRLPDLKSICEPLVSHNVIIYADERSYQELSRVYPGNLLCKAQQEHFGTEFLDYKMSVRTVESIEEAIAHIANYSSKHSECIMTEDEYEAQKFLRSVDAACVYHNVSTAFTDGGQFGFGAEIGISTQKLHARGPMGLRELTTYKYLITGQGQTR